MKDRINIFKKTLERNLLILQERLNDSNLFNFLKERYLSLTELKQRALKYSLMLALILTIFIVPIYYTLSSFSFFNEFKTKYQLSLELLKFRSVPKGVSFLPVYKAKEKIKSLVEKYERTDYTISQRRLRQDKKTKLEVNRFQVKVQHLNIKQAIQMASDLNNLFTLQLKTFELEAAPDYDNRYDIVLGLDHYFVKSKPKLIKPARKRKVSQKSKPVDKVNKKEDRAFRLPATNKISIKKGAPKKKAFKPLPPSIQNPAEK